MSKAAKVLPLGGFFLAALCSAGAALALRARAAAELAPYLKEQAGLGAYAAVFAACLLTLTFLARHVTLSFSFKPKGLEKTRGIAPRLARLVLAALVFAAPLAALPGVKGAASLQTLIAAGEKKAPPAPQGYKPDDRARLKQKMGAAP